MVTQQNSSLASMDTDTILDLFSVSKEDRDTTAQKESKKPVSATTKVRIVHEMAIW